MAELVLIRHGQTEWSATGRHTSTTDLPLTTATVTIEQVDEGRTRMSVLSRFPSAEAMEQILAMGMEEGLKQALSQIDAILAEHAPTR